MLACIFRNWKVHNASQDCIYSQIAWSVYITFPTEDLFHASEISELQQFHSCILLKMLTSIFIFIYFI